MLARQDDALCSSFYRRARASKTSEALNSHSSLSALRHYTGCNRHVNPSNTGKKSGSQAAGEDWEFLYKTVNAERNRLEFENRAIGASFEKLFQRAYATEVQLRNVRAYAARCSGLYSPNISDVKELVTLVTRIVSLLGDSTSEPVISRIPEIVAMISACPVHDKRLYAATEQLKRKAGECGLAAHTASKWWFAFGRSDAVSLDLRWLASASEDESWLQLRDRWDACPLDLRWLAVATNDRSWLLNRFVWKRSPMDLQWMSVVTYDREWLLLGGESTQPLTQSKTRVCQLSISESSGLGEKAAGESSMQGGSVGTYAVDPIRNLIYAPSYEFDAASDRWKATPAAVKLRAIESKDPSIARPSLSEAAQMKLDALLRSDIQSELAAREAKIKGEEYPICGDFGTDMRLTAADLTAMPKERKPFTSLPKSESGQAGLNGLPTKMSNFPKEGSLQASRPSSANSAAPPAKPSPGKAGTVSLKGFDGGEKAPVSSSGPAVSKPVPPSEKVPFLGKPASVPGTKSEAPAGARTLGPPATRTDGPPASPKQGGPPAKTDSVKVAGPPGSPAAKSGGPPGSQPADSKPAGKTVAGPVGKAVPTPTGKTVPPSVGKTMQTAPGGTELPSPGKSVGPPGVKGDSAGPPKPPGAKKDSVPPRTLGPPKKASDVSADGSAEGMDAPSKVSVSPPETTESKRTEPKPKGALPPKSSQTPASAPPKILSPPPSAQPKDTASSPPPKGKAPMPPASGKTSSAPGGKTSQVLPAEKASLSPPEDKASPATPSEPPASLPPKTKTVASPAPPKDKAASPPPSKPPAPPAPEKAPPTASGKGPPPPAPPKGKPPAPAGGDSPKLPPKPSPPASAGSDPPKLPPKPSPPASASSDSLKLPPKPSPPASASSDPPKLPPKPPSASGKVGDKAPPPPKSGLVAPSPPSGPPKKVSLPGGKLPGAPAAKLPPPPPKPKA